MGWFRDDGPQKAALDEAIRRCGRPATRLYAVTDPAASVEVIPTESRIGGTPYAERGDEWPTWGPRAVPYDFAFQLDLRGCEGRPQVPAELLTVWVCWEAIEGDDVDVEGACIVRAYEVVDPSRAVRMDPPPPVSESDYRVKACRLRGEPTRTYRMDWESDPAVAQAARRFRNPARAIRHALRRLEVFEPQYSHIGGYPEWVQDDMLEGDDYVFVAQLEYEPSTNLLIGDAAPIYVVWDISERRFIADCFQSH